MRITGTAAIVTGGASGLGLATAERLSEEGSAVTIVDLPSSDGAGVAERLGPRASFAPADVTDPDEVAAAVAHAASTGPLRILVNCAGIGAPAKVIGRDGPVALEAFDRIIRVNLVGTFNVLRLAAYEMTRNDPVDGERGVIVNTASVAAYEGQIGQPAYAASKGGIVSMTLPIARELADSCVRVNTIAPGLFATPLMDSLPEKARTSLAASVPHPARLGSPAEYAALVEHIVANAYLNGETIRLDGAIRMAPR